MTASQTDEVFGSDSGDITVASEPGKGSVFTVPLPGGIPKDAAMAPTPTQQGGRQVEDA